MNQMNIVRRKNRLWLLILPPVISFAFVSVMKPTGRFAFWIELAIFCLCSFSCGFALAIQHFKTFKQRIWGGIILSGGSLYLISCVVFLGCIPIPVVTHQSPQQIARQHQKIEEQMKENAAKKIPPREASADPSMLDLTPFYDSELPGSDGFQKKKIFRALQPGIHVFDGIKFDARGMIWLEWAPEIKGIEVDRKCSAIYFLNGAGPGTKSPMSALFVIHFVNGHLETVPIVFGQDVQVSHFYHDLNQTGTTLANSIIWQEQIFTNVQRQADFRLYIKKWKNPFPNDTVQTIDFVKPQDASPPLLVAITVVPTNGESK